MILLKPGHFCLCAMDIEASLLNEVCETSCYDTLVLDIKECFDNNNNKFKLVDDLFYFVE